MGDKGGVEPDAGAAAPALVFPIANDFSPGSPSTNPITLPVLLRLVKGAAGRAAQVEAIRAHYFVNAAARQADAQQQLIQQRQLASNVLIGLDSYALYDETSAELTPFGEQLLAAPSEGDADRQFAGHILHNLHGVEVLRIIKSMTTSGRSVNKTSLAEELNRHGFVTKAGTPISTSAKNHLIYLKWLRKAGVLADPGYEVDDLVVRSIAGTSIDDANKATELNDRQKVFAAALRRDFDLNGYRDVLVRDIRANCQSTHPKVFRRTDDLRRAIVDPLVREGWLTHSETAGRSQGRGRGGDSGAVKATDQLATVDPSYLGLGALAGLPAEVLRHLRRPLGQIMEELKSIDTGVKGLALETLAVRLMYELGLTPVAFRERGSENNGGEVDLIAESADTHFHRWMVQCKNTPKVNIEALAKEIGMAVLYKAQVVLLITTGSFSSTVRKHAQELAATTSMQAILIDGTGLAAYTDQGIDGLFRQFELRAREILAWKTIQRGAEADD